MSEVSTSDKRKQVTEQCRVVAHLADAIHKVYSDKAAMFSSPYPGMDKLIDLVGKWSAAHDRDDGYGFEECRREGFPHSSPPDFVQFFCGGHKGCTPDSIVTRIEFVKVDPSPHRGEHE